MSVIWDEATYAAAYAVRVKDRTDPLFGTVVSYGRKLAENLQLAPGGQWGDNDLYHWKHRLAELETKTPMNRASRVLVVGAGFGYLLEVMIDLGAQNVWGTDPSVWIQATKATEARADVAPLILDLDVCAGWQAFKTAGAGQNGKFDFVVSELVVESLDAGTELTTFLDCCEALLRPNGTVVHLLVASKPEDRPDSRDLTLGIRWQDHAAWITERPTHWWVDTEGEEYTVGGGL